MAAATRAFLQAAGLDPASPDLADTAMRVAHTWKENFLDGYAQTAAEVLAGTFADEGGSPVLVRDIAFHSLCPHHLLPYRGRAHVAYLPAGRAVGFSQVVRLVDCFAHRLTLQEKISREIARSLVKHLGARAAMCALEAEQACVALRGVRRSGTIVWTEASAGEKRACERLSALVRMGAPDPNR
jgi:GTP cyclohydrolase I